MRRFWSGIVLCLGLVFGVSLTAAAQEGAAVTAYLFDTANPRLVRVSADGTQVEHGLRLPEGVYLSPFDMTFTHDGNRVAYCMQLPPNDASSGQPSSQVVIRDLQTAVDVHVIDLGPVMGCRVSTFSADDAQLAVGVINYFPGAPDVNAEAPIWQVFVIDAATGQTINGIGSNSSPLFQIEPVTRGAFLPDARYFDNNQIVFSLLPYGTEGLAEYPSYLWQLDDGSISQIENWGKTSVDSLPTGELIWIDYDSSLPAGQPGGPMPSFNVVRLADKTGQARTIFTSSDWIPFRAQFINDGREILIQLLQPFDPNNEMMLQGTRFVALERSGNVRELDAYISFAESAPAPGGFFMLWSEETGGTAPAPVHFDYHSAAGRRELWSITSDNIGVSWSIVWTPPTAASVGDALQPFPAVQ